MYTVNYEQLELESNSTSNILKLFIRQYFLKLCIKYDR